MRVRPWIAVLLSCAALPLAAQTESVVFGGTGDSSVAAAILIWNRTDRDGNGISGGTAGRTLFVERTKRAAPATRIVATVSVTPLRAHGSDRMYDAEERAPQLDFRDTAAEVALGRIDTIGERWLSDVRVVALYENVSDTTEELRDFWSKPFAGIRAREAWRHVTAEDPMMLTFEGAEIAIEGEVYGGKSVWSRGRLDQRLSRRFGPVRISEYATAFAGRSINAVNAFLVGGSWPYPGPVPLYGYRYAQIRIARGIAVNADFQYAIAGSLHVAAHGGVLLSDGEPRPGAALDLTWSWNGIGLRSGVSSPLGSSENRRRTFYGSILASSFLH